jgi:hypothetical protein
MSSLKTRKKKVTGVLSTVFKVDPFGVQLLIVVADDVSVAKKFIIGKYPIDIEIEIDKDKTSGGCYGQGVGVKDNLPYHYLILSKKNLKYSYVLHESMHAIFSISRFHGLVADACSEEYYTYGTQQLFEYIIKELRNNKIKLYD